ncbi:MAG: hypothetical protein N2V74_06845 [Candidatus Methanospirare jalkutatii]|nr:MAG: hypothetical protein N2V74_06845 [Candidatus Methanospirare jalkutatii]
MIGKYGKSGQMHTVEALIALVLIIGAATFASQMSPKQVYTGGDVKTQLFLYGKDFLNLLDMERSDHTSWLYHQINGTVNGSGWDAAANITNEWLKTSLNARGVFCKVEIVNLTADGINVVNSNASFGEPPKETVTVSKLVTLVKPVRVYEVRLALWYA